LPASWSCRSSADDHCAHAIDLDAIQQGGETLSALNGVSTAASSPERLRQERRPSSWRIGAPSWQRRRGAAHYRGETLGLEAAAEAEQS
jgi:hypothetical protein